MGLVFVFLAGPTGGVWPNRLGGEPPPPSCLGAAGFAAGAFASTPAGFPACGAGMDIADGCFCGAAGIGLTAFAAIGFAGAAAEGVGG